MNNLRFLGKKEYKQILEKIKKNYNIKNLRLDCSILIDKKNRIFLISNGIKKIDLSGLNINSVGIYFAKLEGGNLRLSIEGSQLIGRKATKNVIEIGDEDVKKWMSGSELSTDAGFDAFVIIKNKNDFLGSGKCSKGKIMNYIPKSRRIKI